MILVDWWGRTQTKQNEDKKYRQKRISASYRERRKCPIFSELSFPSEGDYGSHLVIAAFFTLITPTRAQFKRPPSLTPVSPISAYFPAPAWGNFVTMSSPLFLSSPELPLCLFDDVISTATRDKFFEYNQNGERYDQAGLNFCFPTSTARQDPTRWVLLIKSWEFLPSEGRNPLERGQVNTTMNSIVSNKRTPWFCWNGIWKTVWLNEMIVLSWDAWAQRASYCKKRFFYSCQ